MTYDGNRRSFGSVAPGLREDFTALNPSPARRSKPKPTIKTPQQIEIARMRNLRSVAFDALTPEEQRTFQDPLVAYFLTRERVRAIPNNDYLLKQIKEHDESYGRQYRSLLVAANKRYEEAQKLKMLAQNFG